MVDLGALYNITQHLRTLLFRRETWASDERVQIVSRVADLVRHQTEVQTELSTEQEAWFVRLRDAVYEAEDFMDELYTRANINSRFDVKGGGCFPKVHLRQYADPIQKLDLVWGKLDCIAEEGSSVFSVQHHEAPDRSVPRRETSFDLDSNHVVGREDDLNKVVDLLLKDHNHEYRDRRFLAITGSAGTGKTTLVQLLYNDTRIQHAFPTRLWVVSSDNDNFQKVEEFVDMQRDSSSRFKTLVVIDEVGNDGQFIESNLRDLLYSVSVTVIITRTAQDVGRKELYELKDLSEESSWQLFKRAAFPDLQNKIKPPDEYDEIGKNIVQKCSNLPLLATKVVGKLLSVRDKSEWIRLQKLDYSELIRLPQVMSILRLITYDNLSLPFKCCFSYCAIFPKDFVISKWILISLWIAQGYIEHSIYGEKTLEDVGEDYFGALLRIGFFEVVEKDEYGEVVSCKINSWMHHVAKYIASKEICVTSSNIDRLGDSIYHIVNDNRHGTENSPCSAIIRSYIQHGCSQLTLNMVLQHGTSLRMLDLSNSDIRYLPDSIGRLFLLRYLNLAHNGFLQELPSSIANLYNLQTMDLRFCSSLKELPEELCSLSQLRCLDIFGCDGLTHMPSGMNKLSSLKLLSQFVVAHGKPNQTQIHGQLRDMGELIDRKGQICIIIPTTYRVKTMDARGDYFEQRSLREVWVRFLESHPIDDSNERVLSYHQDILGMFTLHGWMQRFILWGYQGTILALEIPYELVKFELRSCEKLQKLPFLYFSYELRSLKLHGLRNLVFLQDMGTKIIEDSNFFPSLDEFEVVNAPKLRGITNDSPFPRHPNFFQNLVNIEVRSCEKLRHLPFLSGLPHLKSAKLCGLNNLVYLEDCTSGTFVEELRVTQSRFFPSLERLEIVNAAKLKGFCGVSALADNNCNVSPAISCFPNLRYLILANLPELRGFFFEKSDDVYTSIDHVYVPQLGCLSELKVSSCPQLMSMPVIPMLESLSVSNVHRELLYHILSIEGFSESSSVTQSTHKVHTVVLDSVNDIECLPISMLQVESLTIRQCQNLCKLALRSDPVSIEQLIVHDCVRLKHISPALQLLSSLKELDIDGCQELDWGMKYGDNGKGHKASWQSLKNLHSLKLTNISKCESLLIGIGYLSSLERLHLSWLCDLRALSDSIEQLPKLLHLSISHCPNFTVFPEALCRMSNLQMLDIQYCCRLRIPESVSNNSSQPAIRIYPKLNC